jgi:hypothetical protein
VVYNKETAVFEYIGEEPLPLKMDGALTDIDTIMEAIRRWLAKNDRLTVKSIFESLDK